MGEVGNKCGRGGGLDNLLKKFSPVNQKRLLSERGAEKVEKVWMLRGR